MMIMLLDHTRDFVHAGALTSDPTDPATTTVAIFFTRWITHYCAPTFVFLSGLSIYLQKQAGKSNSELSRFLVTRGFWLIFLEFTVIRFSEVFNLDYSYFGMAQVIWVIGVSMIVMAALIYLPVKLVGFAGLAMIVLHNLLDRFNIPPQIAFAGDPPPDVWQIIWAVLHQQSIVPMFGGTSTALIAYPLIPWVGVMAAGYAFGTLYDRDRESRRKWLFAVGGAATILFIIVRLINIYGDPAPWSEQSDPTATFLSFLNTSKYPPSLLYLLMTLGPSIIVLGLTDSIEGKAIWQRIGIVYGRVPMFYYILQWFVSHTAGIVLSLLAGKEIGYFFVSTLAQGQAAPPEYGFPLWVAYAAWITGLVLLYPLCLFWGNLKRRNNHWLLSYL